jgi:hypothetical protein
MWVPIRDPQKNPTPAEKEALRANQSLYKALERAQQEWNESRSEDPADLLHLNPPEKDGHLILVHGGISVFQSLILARNNTDSVVLGLGGFFVGWVYIPTSLIPTPSENEKNPNCSSTPLALTGWTILVKLLKTRRENGEESRYCGQLIRSAAWHQGLVLSEAPNWSFVLVVVKLIVLYMDHSVSTE